MNQQHHRMRILSLLFLLLLCHCTPPPVIARLTDDEMQSITDASTGTITSMNPFKGLGKEKLRAAVHAAMDGDDDEQDLGASCDEIMAKAVIVTAQEKDQALTERDEALKKVQEVTNELKDVKVQLEMAMSEAKKNDTAGKDEMKLITDQLTLKDQEKIKLEKKIEAKDQECVLAIETKQNEMKDLKQSLENQMEQVKTDAKERMLSINATATKQIQEMEQLLEATKNQSASEIESIKEQSLKRIESITYEKEEELLNQSTLRIDQIQKEADDKLVTMTQQLNDVYTAMEELKNSTKAEIDSIKIDADTRVNEAYAEANKRETDAMEKAFQIERDIKRQMEDNQKETNKIIENTYKEAEKEYNKLKKEASDEMNNLVKEIELQMNKQTELDQLLDESIRERKELQSTIDSMNEQLEAVNLKSSSLESQLSDTKQELDYWKAIGSNPTYFNTTLLLEDIHSFTTRTTAGITSKIRQSKSNTILKAEQFIQQRVETMKQLYDEYIQKSFDTTIIPFYEEKVINVIYMTNDKIYENVVHIHKSIDTTIIPFYRNKVVPVIVLTNGRIHEFIDIIIIPFYNDKVVPVIDLSNKKIQEHVVPVVKPYLLELQSKAVPHMQKVKQEVETKHKEIVAIMQKLHTEIKITKEDIFVKTKTLVESKAGAMLILLKEKAPTMTPSFVFSFLEKVEQDASDIIIVSLKFFALLIVFKMRYVLLSKVVGIIRLLFHLTWYLASIPFRSIWFFFPLKFLFRKRSKEVIKHDKTKGIKLNGAHHVKKEIKKER